MKTYSDTAIAGDEIKPGPAWLWPATGVSAVVLALLAGAWIDQRDELLLAQRQQDFAAGRAQGHSDMVATAEAAWKAAQTEAERCSAKAQP